MFAAKINSFKDEREAEKFIKNINSRAMYTDNFIKDEVEEYEEMLIENDHEKDSDRNLPFNGKFVSRLEKLDKAVSRSLSFDLDNSRQANNIEKDFDPLIINEENIDKLGGQNQVNIFEDDYFELDD